MPKKCSVWMTPKWILPYILQVLHQWLLLQSRDYSSLPWRLDQEFLFSFVPLCYLLLFFVGSQHVQQRSAFARSSVEPWQSKFLRMFVVDLTKLWSDLQGQMQTQTIFFGGGQVTLLVRLYSQKICSFPHLTWLLKPVQLLMFGCSCMAMIFHRACSIWYALSRMGFLLEPGSWN